MSGAEAAGCALHEGRAASAPSRTCAAALPVLLTPGPAFPGAHTPAHTPARTLRGGRRLHGSAPCGYARAGPEPSRSVSNLQISSARSRPLAAPCHAHSWACVGPRTRAGASGQEPPRPTAPTLPAGAGDRRAARGTTCRRRHLCGRAGGPSLGGSPPGRPRLPAGRAKPQM